MRRTDHWITLGYAALGFLVGNLVGLPSHSVVTGLLSLLFAFGGSSILVFISKVGLEDRAVAGKCIFALSLACLFGTYTGIMVSEWRLLTPPSLRSVNLSNTSARSADN